MSEATALSREVEWFGASRRLVGGQPDSRYGWIETPQGPCIVKALDPGLTAYAGTLLQHERQVLARLAELGAPAPACVDLGRPDWLVTRFAGLSLQRLQPPPGSAVPDDLFFPEQLAAWIHLLRRLDAVAELGVLAVDLYAANVVLPLTQGIEGQLRLNEACLIDHAHTIAAGMAIRRPVWLSVSMRHIAPELREAMRLDQQELADRFRAVGADLPGYSRRPTEQDQFNRRMWAEYDAPQRLQALLDEGELRPGRAMQFAAGTQVDALLPLAPGAVRRSLRPVVQRMLALQPAARYPSLGEAADALASQMEAIPLVSRRRWGPLRAQDLGALGFEPAATASAVVSGLATRMAEAMTFTAGWPAVQPVPQGSAQLRRWLPGRGWLFAGVALGAAIGTAWPW